MTTPQFIGWLDDKMAGFGNGKLVPPATVLTNDLSETLEGRLHRQIAERILREARIEEEVAAALQAMELPGPELVGATIVHRALADQPAASWRDAIMRVAEQLLASHGSLIIAGERAVIAQRWDNEAVARRLEEAANTLARLPEERVRGLYDLWPRLVGAPCDMPVRPQLRRRQSTGWTRRSDGCAGWSPMSGGWFGSGPRACRGSGSRTGSASAAPRHGSGGPWLCSRSWSG